MINFAFASEPIKNDKVWSDYAYSVKVLQIKYKNPEGEQSIPFVIKWNGEKIAELIPDEQQNIETIAIVPTKKGNATVEVHDLGNPEKLTAVIDEFSISHDRGLTPEERELEIPHGKSLTLGKRPLSVALEFLGPLRSDWVMEFEGWIYPKTGDVDHVDLDVFDSLGNIVAEYDLRLEKGGGFGASLHIERYLANLDGLHTVVFSYDDGKYSVEKEIEFIGSEDDEEIFVEEPKVEGEDVSISDPVEEKIPDWVRNIFIWYAEERISEKELLDSIEFLIDYGIINPRN